MSLRLVRQNLITELGHKYTSSGGCFQISINFKKNTSVSYTFLIVGPGIVDAVFCRSFGVIAMPLLFMGFYSGSAIQ
jgi:hypothetical protein